MMMRNLNIILMLTSAIALAGVYGLKFSIEDTANERSALIAKIKSQEGDLSLLKADWAALNQPGHIEPIVRRHQEALGIGPVQQEQFGTFADLPMRPAAPDNKALNALFESLDAGVDPIDAILEGLQ
ncbi:hypothetical protein PSQ90_13665 [Devosia rhodophyticola]|uniref:Cell division protein FtsL n=1 Tax=Devosia rhodophyticola TaxID=3026423 RepID=A0ABY7YW41_9HYPH|nr:hypothetical protein [Devosia rhodophyticola]WDR05323.1 hypothetical protein PSQ90_13665 [Devosia rhodophyticola]